MSERGVWDHALTPARVGQTLYAGGRLYSVMCDAACMRKDREFGEWAGGSNRDLTSTSASANTEMLFQEMLVIPKRR